MISKAGETFPFSSAPGTAEEEEIIVRHRIRRTRRTLDPLLQLLLLAAVMAAVQKEEQVISLAAAAGLRAAAYAAAYISSINLSPSSRVPQSQLLSQSSHLAPVRHNRQLHVSSDAILLLLSMKIVIVNALSTPNHRMRFSVNQQAGGRAAFVVLLFLSQ